MRGGQETTAVLFAGETSSHASGVALVSLRRSTLDILKQNKNPAIIDVRLRFLFHFELADLLSAGLLVPFPPALALLNGASRPGACRAACFV